MTTHVALQLGAAHSDTDQLERSTYPGRQVVGLFMKQAHHL